MFTIIKTTLISFLIISSSLPLQAKQLVALSYGIADLKFTGDTIQICELGACSTSTFFGLSKGTVWKTIWEHASSFGLPMWLITNTITENREQEIALQYFKALGGTVVNSITDLHKNIAQINFKAPSNLKDITQYHGIVFVDRFVKKENLESIDKFKKNNPYFIFADSTSKKITNNKSLTNQIFAKTCHEIKAPWLMKKKQYTPTLAQEIITEFNHPIYVLKPIGSSLGRGVIIVAQEDLDLTLKTILTETYALQNLSDDSYQFWAQDTEKKFLIEAFIPSKPIEARGHTYDATMRVIYTVTYNHDAVSVEPFANYWRLPKHHLDEQGSLNNMHKSYINHENLPLGFAVASEKDKATIYKIIREKMPSFFTEIMKKNNKHLTK